MFVFSMGSRLLAVFVVVYVLSATQVASQCTTRHCHEDDSEIEADVLTMVLGLRQRLAKQEETILSMNATIHSQNQKLNQKQEPQEAQNASCCASVERLQLEISSIKETLDARHNNTVDRLEREISSIKDMQKMYELKQRLRAKDCADLQAEGYQSSGVYYIYLEQTRNYAAVYCDMETNGGGWLVFQRRQDGSVDFYRDWDDYKRGFGNLSGEFWLGNDNLHYITSAKRYELRIDMDSFDYGRKYAIYSNFSVGSEDDKYKLNLGSYNGTAGNTFYFHDKQFFSTIDRDYDGSSNTNCAKNAKSGWWHYACHIPNLNGPYNGGFYGLRWTHLETGFGSGGSLKTVEMKLKPYTGLK